MIIPTIAAYEKNIQLKTERNGSGQILLLHEFSDPFLLEVPSLSEGICHFLACATDSEVQKPPP